MLTSNVLNALNKQFNAELYASDLYLAMSGFFEAKDLPGMAAWMRMQSNEERGHAMKIYTYISDREGQPTLEASSAPPAEWASPLAVFENALEHEQKVTASINSIVDTALAEKDHATATFLNWFVTEQVEEEATASAIIAKLKMAGDSPNAILMLDAQLGGRGATSAG